MELDKIYCGDAVEVLMDVDDTGAIKDESIDLSIMSPPYKVADGFSYSLINRVFRMLYRVMKKDSLFFLNFGHLVEDKMRPFKVAKSAEDAGFKLAETFVWIKNHYKPIQGRRRVNNLTEFIFMFYKGRMPLLDRLSIGVPYADKSNIGRYAKEDLKCGGNVWHIPYETINKSEKKLHHDGFPLGLPERCIKLANLEPGSVVLDCFAGSCTTAVAATKLGHNYIMIENNPDAAKVGEDRVHEFERKYGICK